MSRRDDVIRVHGKKAPLGAMNASLGPRNVKSAGIAALVTLLWSRAEEAPAGAPTQQKCDGERQCTGAAKVSVYGQRVVRNPHIVCRDFVAQVQTPLSTARDTSGQRVSWPEFGTRDRAPQAPKGTPKRRPLYRGCTTSGEVATVGSAIMGPAAGRPSVIAVSQWLSGMPRPISAPVTRLGTVRAATISTETCHATAAHSAT